MYFRPRFLKTSDHQCAMHGRPYEEKSLISLPSFYFIFLFPFTKSLLGSHHDDSYTSDYEINKDQVQIHILKHQSNNVNSFLKSLLPSMGFLSVSSTLFVKWLCGNSSPFLLLPVRVCSGCSAGFVFPQVPLRLCSQFCSFWIYFLLHPCI